MVKLSPAGADFLLKNAIRMDDLSSVKKLLKTTEIDVSKYPPGYPPTSKYYDLKITNEILSYGLEHASDKMFEYLLSKLYTSEIFIGDNDPAFDAIRMNLPERFELIVNTYLDKKIGCYLLKNEVRNGQLITRTIKHSRFEDVDRDGGLVTALIKYNRVNMIPIFGRIMNRCACFSWLLRSDTEHGRGPYHYFVLNPDMIQILYFYNYRGGEAVNRFDKYGMTPLYLAMVEKNTSKRTIKYLIDRGANLQFTLNLSIEKNNFKVMKRILAGSDGVGVDINGYGGRTAIVSGRQSVSHRWKYTPLMVAAAYGRHRIIKYLLAHGADPEMKEINGDGKTALRFTADNSILHIDTPQVTNRQINYDEFSLSPLGSPEDYFKSAKLLIEAGANIDEVNKNGVSVLTTAAAVCLPYNGNIYEYGVTGPQMLPLFEYLLSQGADPNIASIKGNTTLTNVARIFIPENYEIEAEIIKLLFLHGADLHHINNEGHNVIDILLSQNNHELIELLSRLGMATDEVYPLHLLSLHSINRNRIDIRPIPSALKNID